MTGVQLPNIISMARCLADKLYEDTKDLQNFQALEAGITGGEYAIWGFMKANGDSDEVARDCCLLFMKSVHERWRELLMKEAQPVGNA
ncbi:hypothetical protein FKW31_13325 [Acetobacter sp. DmW_136]|uniref:hypothetical protein n=1 Tax=Acetobacter sp. DmW_136 TaxID=2591091 RepID=UPI00123BF153|nr:hypothetical protein [Acetobacter sp. DmW_136]KAA8384142.1 hypothetical protein FKW31_13325 [Acetobacter sp. DmW_136]